MKEIKLNNQERTLKLDGNVVTVDLNTFNDIAAFGLASFYRVVAKGKLHMQDEHIKMISPLCDMVCASIAATLFEERMLDMFKEAVNDWDEEHDKESWA